MRTALPKVSVLMPVFNEQRFIRHAVESVLNQRTNFVVELIIIDDGSTDETPQIIADLAKKNSSIRLISNRTNSGKGFSVREGFKASRGEYFHILDGDDFFTSRDKLQRQVEFLEENRGFFAVGHNTMVRTDGGLRVMNGRISEESWSNDLCLSGKVYCHTSSLLFRKIVRELPIYFLEREFRGDTALFFFHAYTTKQKCKYLPHIWSIYNYHGAGLWSGMSAVDKKELNLRIVEVLRDKVVDQNDEHVQRLMSERLQSVQASVEGGKGEAFPSVNDFLTFARRASSKVFTYRHEAFKRMYAFRLVDEVCETIGRSTCIDLGICASDTTYNETEAVILVSGLVPGGGGVFREIKELVEILIKDGYTVGIVSTQSIPTDAEIFEQHFNEQNLWYWLADEEASFEQKLKDTLEKLFLCRPSVLFPFITHNDSVGCASIQHGISEEIVLDYVYDHGLSMAVTNSSIDTVIVKTVSQAQALKVMLPNIEFSLIPPFMKDHKIQYHKSYRPMHNGVLNTASAAARDYKLDSQYKYSYAKLIPEILAKTGGRHVHYGPLSEEVLDTIYEGLKSKNIDEDQFCHIRWTNQFGRSLIEDNVSLFIAPFPVCSARIAMEVMAVGVPSVNHHLENTGIPQSIEFVDPQQFVWKTPEDLFGLIENVTEEELLERSFSARQYFKINNDAAQVSERLSTRPKLILGQEKAPEFVIAEFSKSFSVEVETNTFGGRKVFSPNISKFAGRC